MTLKSISLDASWICDTSPFRIIRHRLALVMGFFSALGLVLPASTIAQTQTYPCETVTQFGTGMSTNGAKLRPGSVSPFFLGTDTIFPDRPDTYVVTDPPAAWIANSASVDSQWIGPSRSTADDVAGTYVYRLQILSPCAGATLTGRYAASDRGVLRLNGAALSFPTPASGWTAWTPFSFNNLLPGINRLEFYVTNSTPAAGGPAGPTGLRAELTVTATCCPCIELTCPPDISLTTCSNGAPANFSITGTNRCYTNLTINCSVNVAGANIPVVSGSVFPVGTNNVICNASDTIGHRTNCSFRVVVTRDTRAPEIRCPQDIVYLCGDGGTNVFYSPTITDDVDSNPIVTCVPPSGSFLAPGTNQVICEARDDCGRIARCSFNVVISPAGFTQTLQAGAADNFSPAGLEAPTAGPCLGASGFFSVMPFDTAWTDRHLAHCFHGLLPNVTAAKLSLRMKPTQLASQDDVLRLGLQNCGLPAVWAFVQTVATLPGAGGSWTTNGPTTFVIDLAALPGGGNLLAQLNASQRLEFAVGTDTLVDYARLEVTSCGPQSTFSGVPYSLNNVQTTHRGDGISWRRVNSNGPPATVEFGIGQADGLRFDFNHGIRGTPLLCGDILQDRVGQSIAWLPESIAAATASFVFPGTNFSRVMVMLDQPIHQWGKAVEVWHDGQLVSRYFFTGAEPTGVTVPREACVDAMGFTTSYFFVNFTGLQDIDLRAPGYPATATPGTHVSGQVGPVVMGTSVRLYFFNAANLASAGPGQALQAASGLTIDQFQPRKVQLTLGANDLTTSRLAVRHDDEWLEPHGSLQISISDVVSWHELPHLPGPSGVCTPAYGPWTLDLNGAIDFCNGDPMSICAVDHVDINLVEEVNFGGLRITPGALGACTIENTVANSANEYIILQGPSGMRLLDGHTSLGAESLPQSISGNAGPQALTVVFPPNTLVFAAGLSELYVATSATFHSQPQVLGQFYQVCVETTFQPQLIAPQFSFQSFQTFGGTFSPDCLSLDCPTNVVVNSTNAGGVAVSFNTPGAARCGSNVVVTCEPPSGSVFPPGASVVQCSAIDSLGFQDQCQFLVTVRPPRTLAVARQGGNRAELRWMGDAIVESTDTLGDARAWRRVTGTPTSIGDERILVLPIDRTRQFFRILPPPSGGGSR